MLESKLVDFAIREAYFIICPHYKQFEKCLNQIQNIDPIQRVIEENLRQQYYYVSRREFMRNYKQLKLISQRVGDSKIKIESS